MNYIQGIDRQQSTAFPMTLEEYVSSENPVRFLDAFVNALNLRELGFTHTVLAATGRSPFHPGDLLKLYLYGYLHGTRSSRKLEHLTKCNVEVMWLLGYLQPDHWVVSNFRKDNIGSLKKVCKTFTLFCKELDLLGGESIGVDGSKFGAVNHSSRCYSKKKIEKMLTSIDEKIAKYFADLDSEDKNEESDIVTNDISLKEKIARMVQEKERLERLQREMEEAGETQIALTDPDSRFMRASTGRGDISYNVQIAVDDKHKLIVAYDATNSMNDLNELSNIAMQAKEILGSEELEALTDMGYFNGPEIKKCHDEKITCTMPRPKRSNNKKRGLYTIDDFQYDATQDCYRCPAGEILTHRGKRTKNGRVENIYLSDACQACLQRSKCTRSKGKGRLIARWEHEHLIEEMQERLRKDPKKMRKRGGLVEHPFGTMKCTMNQRYFLLKGKHKVNGEMGLTVLAYNIKRVLNILGVKRLLEMVEEKLKNPSFSCSFFVEYYFWRHILCEVGHWRFLDHYGLENSSVMRKVNYFGKRRYERAA